MLRVEIDPGSGFCGGVIRAITQAEQYLSEGYALYSLGAIVHNEAELSRLRERGLITVNSLTAANSVIIPVQCEYFALEGISKLLNTIKIIKSKLNPQLEIEGFLLTMYDSRLRLANQIYDEVKRHFQELVFKTVIQRNVKLSESPSHGLPVILYDADSTGSKNHLALAKEIISREK